MKMKLTPDGYVFDDNKFCNFGITEAIVVGSVLEAAIGTTMATALVGAGLGAGVGAAMAAATGGNPLTGALTGGLTGGIGGIAGAAGEAAGIGSTAGSTIGGMASGALSAGITGGNPLTSAALGGAQAFGAAALNGGLNSNTSAAPTDPNAPSAPSAPASSSTPSSSTGLGDVLNSPTSDMTPIPTNGGMTPIPETPLQSTIAEGTGVTPTVDSSLPSSSLSSANGVATPSGLSTTGLVSPDTAGSSPSWYSQAKNYLMGGSGVTTPNVTTMQQATAQAQASGQATVFTNSQGAAMGTVNPTGTISALPAGVGGSATASPNSSGAASSILSKLTANPMQTGLLGLQLYNMSQKPTVPTVTQQQASTQPAGWNSALPQYQYNSTRSPVANYYTYGYSPQTPQISNTLSPVTPTMKTGGRVQRLARGGIPAPHVSMPRVASANRHPSGQGLAALGAISRLKSQQGTSPVNASPVSTSLGALSMARGGQTFARQGQVQMGTGTSGTADRVPAMLSEDEYVVPAAAVAHLGNGSSGAGGKVMDQFVKNVLVHGRSKSGGLPPKAKSPEQYLPRGGR